MSQFWVSDWYNNFFQVTQIRVNLRMFFLFPGIAIINSYSTRYSHLLGMGLNFLINSNCSQGQPPLILRFHTMQLKIWSSAREKDAYDENIFVLHTYMYMRMALPQLKVCRLARTSADTDTYVRSYIHTYVVCKFIPDLCKTCTLTTTSCVCKCSYMHTRCVTHLHTYIHTYMYILKC